MAFIIFLALSLFLHAAHGELVCEELPSGMCSFSIASSGKRCLLETPVGGCRNAEVQCRTSVVMVKNMCDHIESDECVDACGVDRNVVGISSDSLLEPQFMAKLCSPECYKNCPNILDLYFNLALAEGAFLPAVCEGQEIGGSRREMAQLLSSGAAPYVTMFAPAGPTSAKSDTYVVADGPMSAKYVVAEGPLSAKYVVAEGSRSAKYVVAEGPTSDNYVVVADGPMSTE